MGDAGSVVADGKRRNGARRHLPQNGLRGRGDLRISGVQLYSGMKEDLNDARPSDSLRLDVIDIVDYGR